MKKIIVALSVVILSGAAFGQATVIGNQPAVFRNYPTCNNSVAPPCKISLTGQTAAIGSFGSPVSLYTVPADGVYRISIAMALTAQGTAGTITAQGSFFPVAGNKTSWATGAITTTAAIGTPASNVSAVHAAAGTVLGYFVAFAGVTGSPAYTLDVIVE